MAGITVKGSFAGDKYLVDDFEYWDSPYSHGWRSSDYSYSIYGYQIGYGHFQTILDFQEGSRVLEVFYQPSFLNRFATYSVAKLNLRDPDSGYYPVHRYFSIKVQTDFALESFAFLCVSLLIKTAQGKSIRFSYLPVDRDAPWISAESIWADPFCPNWPQIFFPIGRVIQDGGWHWVISDLKMDLEEAAASGLMASDDKLEGIYGIIIQGNHFRVDEIIFQDDLKETKNRPPFIWFMGPQFATLFQPFELILYADDRDGDPITWKATIGGSGAYGMGTAHFLDALTEDPNMSFSDPESPLELPVARARLSFIPQILENFIVTIQASDGQVAYATTFPLIVVNYPISNHPPFIQRAGYDCKFKAKVGARFRYRVKAFDQDYDQITFMAYIDGLPSYQYGPWSEQLIDPQTGWLDFIPRFEANHELTVIAIDDRGMWSSTTWKLTVHVDGAGWLNHPPVKLGKPRSYQIIRAGEAYVYPTCFEDPDDDRIYYSCNIGAVSNDGVFSFRTYFPGLYQVKIIGYDIRGGMDSLEFVLDVQPWWSI